MKIFYIDLSKEYFKDMDSSEALEVMHTLLDRSLVSVDEFVEFMESLGYGNGVEVNSGTPIDRDISDGLRYIRRKLKRSTASSDVKVFTDWSRKNINSEEALEIFTKNNKMDKKMIPVESFIMFMNGVGYYA